MAHLGAARFAEARRRAADLGPGRTVAVLHMLADLHTGPLYRAMLELWVAARTDDALCAAAVPLEDRRAAGRRRHLLDDRARQLDHRLTTDRPEA